MDVNMNITLHMLHQTMNLNENQVLVRVKPSKQQIPGVVTLKVQDLQTIFSNKAARYNRTQQLGELKNMFAEGQIQVLEKGADKGAKLLINKNLADKLHGAQSKIVMADDDETEVTADFVRRADATDQSALEMLERDIEETGRESQKPSETPSYHRRQVADLPQQMKTKTSPVGIQSERGKLSSKAQESKMVQQRLEQDRLRLRRDKMERQKEELKEDKERARELRREAQYGKGPVEKRKASESATEIRQSETVEE